MTDPQREEWSRHYDGIHWNVIALFTTGIAALSAYSSGQPITATTGPAPLSEIAGLALIQLEVFYVASFRSFRNTLHGVIKNKGLKDFLENPSGDRSGSQWNICVLFFAAICLLLAWRPGLRLALQIAPKVGFARFEYCFAIIFVVCVGVLGAVLPMSWKLGKPSGEPIGCPLAKNEGR